MNVQWEVSPDYGEYDHDIVPRFKDAGNGFKHNGWTNPLSWTDNGNDDEGVLVLTKTDGSLVEVKDETFLQYAESEGPTKVDFGELDQAVVPRFKDAGNGFKHNGWTNPLSWTDNGEDDEVVLLQTKTDGSLIQRRIKDNILLQYAESEGPTKVDFGELDQAVVPRFKDAGNGFKHNGWTNPLSWTDNGEDDEVVLLQQRQRMHYDHSDFDVPADNGLGDENVVNFVQLSDEKDGDEEDDNTEAQLTAESIITQQKYQVDRGYGDEEVL
jgi:hypothetical protein